MPINVLQDQLLTLGDACRLLPRPPSPATLWRWRVRGVNGVKLECVRVGGSWATTAEAVAEFLLAQTNHAARPESMYENREGRSETTTRRLRNSGLLSD